MLRSLLVVGLSAALLLSGTTGSLAEVSKLRIGLQFGLAYLAVIVAQNEGLIAKRAASAGIPNLHVSLLRFSGSTAINEALLSNSIDVGTLGTGGALIAWDKTRGRQQIKSLANISSVQYSIYTNTESIKSLKDFGPDDKIAVPAFNSPQAIYLRVASERLLGDREKVEPLMVNLPHPDAVAALLAGTAIRGYVAVPPYLQLLARDPRMHSVLSVKQMLGAVPSAGTMTASQAFVEDNPKVARAVFDGLEDAMKLIAQSPRRAAEIYLASEKVNLPLEDVSAILTDGSTTYSVAPDGIIELAGFMASQKLLRKVPGDWKEVFFPYVHDRAGN